MVQFVGLSIEKRIGRALVLCRNVDGFSEKNAISDPSTQRRLVSPSCVSISSGDRKAT